jgi:hypothetical protein
MAELSQRARRWFERHILDCDDCWREVLLGRFGRRMAEDAASRSRPGSATACARRSCCPPTSVADGDGAQPQCRCGWSSDCRSAPRPIKRPSDDVIVRSLRIEVRL